MQLGREIDQNVDVQVQWSARMVKTFHSCHFAITADYGWCCAHISKAEFQLVLSLLNR